MQCPAMRQTLELLVRPGCPLNSDKAGLTMALCANPRAPALPSRPQAHGHALMQLLEHSFDAPSLPRRNLSTGTVLRTRPPFLVACNAAASRLWCTARRYLKRSAHNHRDLQPPGAWLAKHMCSSWVLRLEYCHVTCSLHAKVAARGCSRIPGAAECCCYLTMLPSP